MTIQHFGEWQSDSSHCLFDDTSTPLAAFSKFKSGVNLDEQSKAFETARELIAPIPGVKNLHVGPPVNTTYAQGYGFGKYSLLSRGLSL